MAKFVKTAALLFLATVILVAEARRDLQDREDDQQGDDLLKAKVGLKAFGGIGGIKGGLSDDGAQDDLIILATGNNGGSSSGCSRGSTGSSSGGSGSIGSGGSGSIGSGGSGSIGSGGSGSIGSGVGGCICNTDDSEINNFINKFRLLFRAYASKQLVPELKSIIIKLVDFTLNYLAQEKPEEMTKINTFFHSSADITDGVLVSGGKK